MASILSETIVLSYQYYHVRKDITISCIFSGFVKYFIAGTIMFLSLNNIQKFLPIGVTNTFFVIVLGAIIYTAILILIKDEYLISILKNAIDLLKNKIKKLENH